MNAKLEQVAVASTADDIAVSPGNLVRNSILAGSAAGVASTIACYPMDVIRVKMQSTVLASSTSGVIGTTRQVLQSGGVRALYTGLAIPLGAQAVYKSTVFTVNNVTEQAIKEWKNRENEKHGNSQSYTLTSFDRFFSGCMGGVVNGALFVTPVEFVRNQQISQMHRFKEGTNTTKTGHGPFTVIRDTLRSDGITGLWRGTVSTVLRDSLGCGCFFVTMAYAQKNLSSNENEKPSKPVLVASGAMAGIAFWLVGLPLDTMKTWVQNGSARNLRHAWKLVQGGGLLNAVSSLNRGWQVAYGRGAPSAAITVTTYSLMFSSLEQVP